MTHVMPSQVVETIDRLFPNILNGKLNVSYDEPYSAQLRGIVNMVKEIPQELLVFDQDSYCSLIISIGAIEQKLNTWSHRRSDLPLTPIDGVDPVLRVREALSKCPDEYPPQDAALLTFIPDEELRNSISLDVGAANRAFLNAEWKAATVLAGSSIEALLHWKLSLDEVTTLSAFDKLLSNKKLTSDTPRDIDQWGLFIYTTVAASQSTINNKTQKAVDLAREFRNLIHPGRSKRLSQNCNRATAHSALAALYHVIEEFEKSHTPAPHSPTTSICA